jgi:hypothetical protein
MGLLPTLSLQSLDSFHEAVELTNAATLTLDNIRFPQRNAPIALVLNGLW